MVIGLAWMGLLHYLRPAGLVGGSVIIGDRDSGAVYVNIDGRLYPALNLTSARLAAGSAAAPAWVTAGEIAKYPTAPMIGIPGAPGDLRIGSSAVSAWAVCDTAASRGGGAAPAVTAIAGELAGAGRAAPMTPTQAILVTHRDATYLLWNGHRSRIDPGDRSVTLHLGLDPAVTRPVAISNALFDAMPAAEPIVVPVVPEVGTPSRWLADLTVGSVLETRDAAGTVSGFYALLPGGVQKISSFVADVLRTDNPQGVAGPRLVAPDQLVSIPVVDVLNVDYYPAGRLTFVDTFANPVTCVTWQKQAGDPTAAITVASGRRLPVPAAQEAHVVSLVRDDRSPDSVEADHALVLPGAANLVATTSIAAVSDSRESLYWLSPQGVRYGISWDQPTLAALGLDARTAVQAPWPLVRTFAAGPALSRDGALLEHDALAGAGAVAAVPGTGSQQTGG